MKAALALMLLAGSASAGEVLSKAPDAVAATLYQSYRGVPDIALIVETRTIDLPAGDSVLRFDGVASTLIPATAQVSGLPEPPREGDFDFDLFDAATILRKSVGAEVDLVETPAKSAEIHHRGTLVADQGVLRLKNEDGVEDFGCGGPPAHLDVPVPQGLRAVPSLSVHLHADHAEHRTIRLSYLADRIRWHAAYVATISADRRHIALTGRIVLDNKTPTAFDNVPARFVAGEVFRGYGTSSPIIFATRAKRDCWPSARTTDAVGWDPGKDYLDRMVRETVRASRNGFSSESPMAFSQAAAAAPAMAVTEEKLGDLKLYRLSEPIRIAAQQQKMFQFLALPSVEAAPSFSLAYNSNQIVQGASAQAVWHFLNRADHGAGKSLPRGAVVLYDAQGNYWGEDSLKTDIADHEVFDLKGLRLGEVTFDHWLASESRTGRLVKRSHVLVLHNTLDMPVTVDLSPAVSDTLSVTLAPHADRRLTYETVDSV